MTFHNSYEMPDRAEAYSKLDFSGTYYVAFRDLQEIILSNVKGQKALDFGCGSGRSTRFLKKLGFQTIGVDISEAMLRKAVESDSSGEYRLIRECDLDSFEDETFDLVLSSYTFDNIPTEEKKVANFKEICRVMKKEARMFNIVSSPEMYTHEWVSFSTKNFPENKKAKIGDKVRVQFQTDTQNEEPVIDVFWPDQAYREVYKSAGLEIVGFYKPLGKRSDPFKWISEKKIAPWIIYLLKKSNL